MDVRVSAMPAPRPRNAIETARSRDRAHVRSRWAEKRSRSDVLAPHYGVSASRVRHFTSDDSSGPLSAICAAVADPAVDAGPIVAAVLASFEDRFVYLPTPDLRTRLAYLKNDAEHLAEARQNRALQVNDPMRCDALMEHASMLIEMATLEGMLG